MLSRELASQVHDLRDLLLDTDSGSGPDPDAAGLIDLIAALEDLKSTACATQARATVRFDTARRAEEAARGVPARRQGRGVASEVALARKVSPHRGRVLVGLAKMLCTEMPHTLDRLGGADLDEHRALSLVRETACLNIEDRAQVDERICSDAAALEGVGMRELEARVKAAAYEADPKAFVRRSSQARGDRHVTLRPAPDTMAYLTALVPVEQGVAAYQAVSQQAAALKGAGDRRSKGQLMADLVIAHLTGQEIGPDGKAPVIPICLNITMPVESLAGGHAPGLIESVPVPAELARRLAAAAITNGHTNGRGSGHDDAPDDGRLDLSGVGAWFRRLYTDGSGRLVALSSKQRLFDSGLAAFLDLRDQGICRTPYCDAPVRHHDHIRAHEHGGATDAENGQGLCEACNHAKQAPGWRQEPVSNATRHQVVTMTPTGHRYASTAPPPVGASPPPAPPAAPRPPDRLDIGYPADVGWTLAA